MCAVSKYPKFEKKFALRQVGEDFYYLVDPRSGDFFELEKEQLNAFKLSNGSRSFVDISEQVKVPYEEVEAFFIEQEKDGFLEILDVAQTKEEPYYNYSEPPHLSDCLIEITGNCNLECSHCYNSELNTPESIKREMTTDEILKLISELDSLNLRRLQLSGGEALLREDLWTIINAIDSHRIFLDVISTNATLITEENVQLFSERFQKHGALYISMDGVNEKSYESLRGKGTFPIFSNAINLLAENDCRMFINTMAVRSNLDQMDAMYDWMVQHPSVQGWRIGLPKVLGRYLDHHKEFELEFQEVIKVFKHILVRWLNERPHFRLELSDFFRTDSFETGLENHHQHDSPCKYAETNMSIKPDGTAVFCASLEIYPPAVLGNVVSDGLESVWHGERHKAFRDLRISSLDVCRECRYARLCGGGCRSNALLSYNDINSVDPRACTAMQILEGELLPLFPVEYKEEVEALIDCNKDFKLPTGFRLYI